MTKKIKISNIEKIALTKDDVLLITTEYPSTEEWRNEADNAINILFPGVRRLYSTKGISFKVISQETAMKIKLEKIPK